MQITFRLAHVAVQIDTPDADLARRLATVFAPALTTPAEADIHVRLWQTADLPALPAGPPVTQQEGTLAYYLHDDRLVAHFVRWGQLQVDLRTARFDAYLLPACVDNYGALEDMLLIGLAPLLRRHGLFTVHAFAASRGGRAVLLIGDPGAGKTTTGISLLRQGWSLLSNDSPLLRADGTGPQVMCYPGMLSATADSLRRFPELAPLLSGPEHPPGKRFLLATQYFPGVWAAQAVPAALCFPEITPGLARSSLERLDTRQALLALIGQSIENWDRPQVSPHLALLGRLVEAAPAYRLRLAPDVEDLPALLARVVENER